jgi:uncharacterized protein YbjQ (UPF0145 family)
MTKAIKCHFCKKEFGILRWRNECTECGKTFCSDCSEVNRFLHRRICKPCTKEIEIGMSLIKVVKSDHVGGHNIKKSYDVVTGQNWECNQQDTVNNIKYQAYKIGANALVSLDICKDTHSEPGSGKGTHYYSVFRASARPTVIEKRSEREKSERNGNIASELEKLATLKEKGLITEDEFISAKKQIIR